MFDRAEPDSTHVAFATPIASLSSNEMGTSRVFDRLAMVVIGVVGVLSLLTFRDYGLALWRSISCTFAGAALSWINLYYYGGGFDLLAALAAKILPFTLFETRRLIGAAGQRHLLVGGDQVGQQYAPQGGHQGGRHRRVS